VTAFANNATVKDVTRRYASQWMTSTQKGRDSEWWVKSLKPYRGRRTQRDRAEDEFLDQHLQSMPIPKSIQEYVKFNSALGFTDLDFGHIISHCIILQA